MAIDATFAVGSAADCLRNVAQVRSGDFFDATSAGLTDRQTRQLPMGPATKV
jgi:hypothetical protein